MCDTRKHIVVATDTETVKYLWIVARLNYCLQEIVSSSALEDWGRCKMLLAFLLRCYHLRTYQLRIKLHDLNKIF